MLVVVFAELFVSLWRCKQKVPGSWLPRDSGASEISVNRGQIKLVVVEMLQYNYFIRKHVYEERT